MMDVYKKGLQERVNRRCPGAWERLSEIGTFPDGAAEAVLQELLETGCLSQNAANIEAARRAVLRLPPDWLNGHLPAAVRRCLFREPGWQEWEFRRAAEMLQGPFPDAFAWLAEYAKALQNPEVDEAMEDFAEETKTEDGSVP